MSLTLERGEVDAAEKPSRFNELFVTELSSRFGGESAHPLQLDDAMSDAKSRDHHPPTRIPLSSSSETREC